MEVIFVAGGLVEWFDVHVAGLKVDFYRRQVCVDGAVVAYLNVSVDIVDGVVQKSCVLTYADRPSESSQADAVVLDVTGVDHQDRISVNGCARKSIVSYIRDVSDDALYTQKRL